MFVWLTLKYFKIYEVSVVTPFPFSLQKQNYVPLLLHLCLLWLLSPCLYVSSCALRYVCVKLAGPLCADIWSRMILDVSVRMFVDEIYI